MKDICYHCGQEITDTRVDFDEKSFCCQGCKSVYEILSLSKLDNYYELNNQAGIRPDNEANHWEYLDTPQIFNKLIDFSEEGTTLITLKIPVIHCSSCVWLLESLKDINPHIQYSTVNFTSRTVQIAFKNEEYKLSELASFLAKLGYKPVINLESADKKEEKVDRSLVIKLAIAGFAFGNIMLMAIPEFFDAKDIWLEQFKGFFRLLMFIISLPVVLYSASDYYKSAWASIRSGQLNIDVPIVIGIFALFGRSCYEAFMDISNGYFDSLCGLLFFMLIGKYFQQRTYKSLAFDRDYKSFYPIAVTKVDFENQENILISELKIGDRILIRNQEIIPADAILIKGEAHIDNSFITGESKLLEKNPGDKIFAGGKQSGAIIELEIIKEVNQSYLTQLWNNDAFKKEYTSMETITNKVSKYFVFVILTITIFSGLYWFFIEKNVSQMFQVISAILIVACPCALALSVPFTMGNVMRILGRNKMYVKDAATIEKISKINHIVFDKTGTLTSSKDTKIEYVGKDISLQETAIITSVLQNSNHPLSRILYKFIATTDNYFPVIDYKEIPGKGISGIVKGKNIKIGSASFTNSEKTSQTETSVFIEIDKEVKGKYVFHNQYRKGVENLSKQISGYYKISLLSGDNDSERETLEKIFPKSTQMKFNQSPEDKLKYVKKLQEEHQKVMMLGDGLNDAGALKQSNVGIAIADDVNTFTPSSDAILDGKNFDLLPQIFKISKQSIQIIYFCFAISFSYNIVGLSFACTGNLSPLVAAILMPISSLSVVSFTTLSTWIVGYFAFKKR